MVQLLTYCYKKATAFFAVVLLVCSAHAAFATSFDFSVFSDKSEIRQGEQVTLTIRVQNYGNADVSDLQVSDSLPKGVVYISSSVADISTGGRKLVVKVPLLRPGDEYSFDLTLRMERKGSIENMLLLQRGSSTVKSASAKLEVLSNNVLNIKVNMFTPNGDGVNDYFEIPGLQDYPNNELVVFNRYSDKVYYRRYYNNDWDADGLPNGNYFYILTLHLDNGTVQKYNGYVTVKR